MRWILVFIIFYLIPLTVIFKNNKKFSRACIYSCSYVVVATSIVIINMYISSIKKLEADLDQLAYNSSSYTDKYVSTFDLNSKRDDMKKIEDFKNQISHIECIALKPTNKSLVNIDNIDKYYYTDTEDMKEQIKKSIYICERTAEMYDDMDIPNLSKKEYTARLKKSTRYMKRAYENKNKAMKEIYYSLENKNKDNIYVAKKYLEQSYNNIDLYKNQIKSLEKEIEGK